MAAFFCGRVTFATDGIGHGQTGLASPQHGHQARADVTLFREQLVAVNDHDASVSATDDSGGLELGKNL